MRRLVGLVAVVVSWVVVAGCSGNAATPPVAAKPEPHHLIKRADPKPAEPVEKVPDWDDPDIRKAVDQGLRYREILCERTAERIARRNPDDPFAPPGWWESLPAEERVATLAYQMEEGVQAMIWHGHPEHFREMIDVMRHEIRGLGFLADDFEAVLPYVLMDRSAPDRDPGDPFFKPGKGKQGLELVTRLDEARAPRKQLIENLIGAYFYLLRERGSAR